MSFFSKFCFTGRTTPQEPTTAMRVTDLESQLFEKTVGFWSRLFSCCFSPRAEKHYKPDTSYHQSWTQAPGASDSIFPHDWQRPTTASDRIIDSATATTTKHDDDGKAVPTTHEEPILLSLQSAGSLSADEEADSTRFIKVDSGKTVIHNYFSVSSVAESSAGSSFEMSIDDSTGDESAPQQVFIRPAPKVHLVTSSIISNGAEHPNLATAAQVGKVINCCWADQPLCSSARQVSSSGSHYADSSHDQSPDTTSPTEIGSPRLAAACSGSAIFKDWEQDQQRLVRTGSPSSEVECHRLGGGGFWERCA